MRRRLFLEFVDSMALRSVQYNGKRWDFSSTPFLTQICEILVARGLVQKIGITGYRITEGGEKALALYDLAGVSR